MGLLKYSIGDKVLLKAEIISAEIQRIHGKECVLYHIRESDNAILEESIVGALQVNRKGAITIPVMLGGEKIDEYVVNKDDCLCWNAQEASVETKQILGEISTAHLVKELAKREAVSVIYAEPYQDVKYSVNGPAMILIVTD